MDPSRTARRRGLPLTAWAVLAAALLLPRAAAADVSAWVRSAQSEARLVGAGPAPDGRGLLAGVEIRLQPRFVTYWRDPGDAGVPPTFAFSGSTNLAGATVRYPAPSRFDEAGAEAFGYADDVVFPILVVPADASKPVDLAVTLDYAACHDICLPAHADLRLTLDRQPTPDAGPVLKALAAVPRPSTVGAGGTAPAVLAVTAPGAAGGFTVRAALPDADGSLFVEAPEGWAYAAGPAVPDGPGRATFPVKQLDAPKGEARPPAPLTLTLTSPAGAVEVPVTLDAAGAKP
ncbi:protein-disulfide reductase DsbD domain-containing protein [Lichenibacterium dinghuense]|uniref:protein-disulfide reductase DsbD domain-containing protein n=1 Tax=Lichenibacterium dinghuense TaxID=2895977 RepID=UPI001F37DF9F|nr:protein-disulfide reductase DsbD domain-containing protein [Lichenibacterium sp. 6Y81]